MNKSAIKTTRKRGWPSCLIDPTKLEGLLASEGRSMRWLWSGDGLGKIDMKTGRRLEQNKPISIRTIFKIAIRLGCDPRQLVSDSDAKIIIETARGLIEISDLVGFWGGHPGEGYMTADYPQHQGFDGHPRDDQIYNHPEIVGTDKGLIPVSDSFFNPGNDDSVLALRSVTATTIASKPTAYELMAILSRQALAPECAPDQQRISLNTEPTILIHDVDAHKDVTKRLVELFKLTQSVVEEKRTFPTTSEIEGHENIRSEVQDHLNWLATRNIQILNVGIDTSFVVRLDDGSEAFTWFAKPVLILAPTTLIDVEFKYPRLELVCSEALL